MAKQQLNLRVSALTLDQIEALVKWWGVSKTELITVLVDRTYQQEKDKRDAKQKDSLH